MLLEHCCLSSLLGGIIFLCFADEERASSLLGGIIFLCFADEERVKVDEWLKRKSAELIFKQEVNFETSSVQSFQIERKVLEILKPYQNVKQRVIFWTYYKRYLNDNCKQSELLDIVAAYHISVKEYEKIQQQLLDGTYSEFQCSERTVYHC